MALALSAWRLHPIHAARVEIDAAADGTVGVVVRVYRDDIPAGWKLAEVGGYLDRVLTITDAHAVRVHLVATGIVAEGDRLKVSLTGKAIGNLQRGHVALTLLQEQFSDQVNVVDAKVQGRRAQLVFLRGDGPQALP